MMRDGEEKYNTQQWLMDDGGGGAKEKKDGRGDCDEDHGI